MKRELYAVAVEILQKDGSVVPHIVYLHADSAGHAKNQYCITHPNRRTHHIVAVGKALGYFVEDKEGNILSVS